MALIKNFTNRLERAEAFIRAKCDLVRSDGLSVHIKYTRASGCDITGYYRLPDRRIVAAVKPGLRYPLRAAYGVAYTGEGRRLRLHSQQVWYEERFASAEDLLVFVAGHEMWHYLCHTRQRREDEEPTANRLGFLWLDEFRRWAGLGHPVDGIPDIPPRPDLQRARSRSGGRRRGRSQRADASQKGGCTKLRPRLAVRASAADRRRSG